MSQGNFEKYCTETKFLMNGKFPHNLNVKGS